MCFKSVRALSASAVLFLATGGIAVASDGYFGGGAGRASYDITPLLGNFEVDSGVAYNFFLGSRNDNMGFETQFGFSEHDWTGLGRFGTASHKVSSIIFSGVAYAPINRVFDIYGKLGVNIWTVNVKADIPALNLAGTYEGDEGISIAYGLGIVADVHESFDIRMEFQGLPGLDDGLDKGDIKQFTFNLAVPF